MCLGAKLAVYEDCDAQDYRERICGHYLSHFPLVGIQLWCARKLIEGAVRYASSLGFAPHRDYKKAVRVFGGLQAEECSQEFVLGHEGKPYYVRGPRETEGQAKQIVWHLERHCGPGNYDYTVILGNAEDINRCDRSWERTSRGGADEDD